MAKRKKARPKADSSPQGPEESRQPLPSDPTNRPAFEAFLQQLLPGMENANPDMEAAQQIMYRAFNERRPERQVALAHKALEVSPDCADAYVMLAEHAESLAEALHWFEQGVAAGERALGERTFQELQGSFWLFPPSRPYMRAREGLANCLWAEGRRDEAVRHFQELLRLNPNDNQGIRYRLLMALLDLERHEELTRLLSQFDEDGLAEWSYTRALLAFRQHGDTGPARELLAKAQRSNPHVPPLLTGSVPMPDDLPAQFETGSFDEAVCYAAQYLPAWRETAGATTWVRKTLHVKMSQPSIDKSQEWRHIKSDLLKLPQGENEVWEVDLRPIPIPPQLDAPGGKAWGLIITSATSGTPLLMELLPDRPADGEVWNYLLDAMYDVEETDPVRPAEIRVARKTWFNNWKAKLQQLEIRCRLSRNLKHIEAILDEALPPQEMLEQLGREPLAPEDWPDPSSLPQAHEEVWQAEQLQLPGWIEMDGQPARPWMYLVADVESHMALATQLDEVPPDSDWLWQGVRHAICAPLHGEPHRPGTVQVSSEELRATLAPHLQSAGIECVVSESMEAVSQLAEELVEHLLGQQRLGALVNSPGTTPELVGEFFAAAAEFYRSRPWRQVGSDEVIRVECSHVSSGPWYMVVMGQSGIELGLALYEDATLLREILTTDIGPQESARRSMGLSVMFGEEFNIAVQDLDASRRYGWPVAGPESYPCAIRLNPGGSVRAPLKWELQVLTGCLRAVTEFVQLQVESHTFDVPMAGDVFGITLTWHAVDDAG